VSTSYTKVLILTQTKQAGDSLDLVREIRLGVFDSVALVKNTVGPTAAFEPAIFSHICLVGGDANIEQVSVSTKRFFEASTFRCSAVKTDGSERWKPASSFLRVNGMCCLLTVCEDTTLTVNHVGRTESGQMMRWGSTTPIASDQGHGNH
jgi:hypothetical protein